MSQAKPQSAAKLQSGKYTEREKCGWCIETNWYKVTSWINFIIWPFLVKWIDWEIDFNYYVWVAMVLFSLKDILMSLCCDILAKWGWMRIFLRECTTIFFLNYDDINSYIIIYFDCCLHWLLWSKLFIKTGHRLAATCCWGLVVGFVVRINILICHPVIHHPSQSTLMVQVIDLRKYRSSMYFITT